jgi:hypothetical protein
MLKAWLCDLACVGIGELWGMQKLHEMLLA